MSRSSPKTVGGLPLAPLVLALCAGAAPLTAVAQIALAPVVVTASRFEEVATQLPVGVTVISAAQIRSAGAATASEALQRIAGIPGRINTGGGRDAVLDLRGFGETAGSNTVLLVDGIRLNEGDQGGASLAWIPIDAIERIEIVRGSGTVLYGEGATAGAINIVTRAGGGRGGQVTAMAGTQDTHELRASAAGTAGALSWFAAGHGYGSDQHRENFRNRDEGGSVKLQWAQAGDRLGLHLSRQSEGSRLPGGLTPQQAQDDPRQSDPARSGDWARNNVDWASVSGQAVRGAWTLAFDASLRERDARSEQSGFLIRSENRAKQFAVRAQRLDDTDGPLQNRLAFGLERETWAQQRQGGSSTIDHLTRSLFVRDDLTFAATGTRVFAGARRTLADREARGDQVGLTHDGLNSWEAGVSQRVTAGWEAYVRLGRSFRLANADEYTCYAAFGLCPPTGPVLLAPQRSHDVELGLKQRRDGGTLELRAYRHDLRNEIAFDAASFANINLAPTRRDGLELDAEQVVAPSTTLLAHAATRRAEFRGGDRDGRTIPLVPKHEATLRLRYTGVERQTFEAGLQWVSASRIGDDWDNTCGERIPSRTRIDARWAVQWDAWEFALTGTNLADRNDYAYRTRCDATLASVYPEPGRQLRVSVQRSF